VHGNELWKSDGTAAGTTLVKDINPGPNGSSVAEPTNVGGELFFSAGVGLWKSDGTAGGTVLVKDTGFDTGTAHTFDRPTQLTSVHDTLFFVLFDGIHGEELWRSDGTNSGTTLVKDVNPGDPRRRGMWLTTAPQPSSRSCSTPRSPPPSSAAAYRAGAARRSR